MQGSLFCNAHVGASRTSGSGRASFWFVSSQEMHVWTTNKKRMLSEYKEYNTLTFHSEYRSIEVLYSYEMSKLCPFRIISCRHIKKLDLKTQAVEQLNNVCPGNSDHFYIVSYNIKRVTTSWKYSILSVQEIATSFI